MVEVELFSGFSIGHHFPAGTAVLDASSRMEFASSAAVKHARFRDFTAVWAKLASKCCVGPPDTRIGIIATGGPMAVPRSLAFAADALERGPRFVNPLGFPATLPGDVATALAAELGAHQFALTAGWNRLAFLDAIRTGERFRSLGLADVVLVYALATGAGLEPVAAGAGLQRPLLEVSLVARLGRATGRGQLIVIENVAIPDFPANVILEWDGLSVRGANSILLSTEALAASFAVILSEAIESRNVTIARLSELGRTTTLRLTPS